MEIDRERRNQIEAKGITYIIYILSHKYIFNLNDPTKP